MRGGLRIGGAACSYRASRPWRPMRSRAWKRVALGSGSRYGPSQSDESAQDTGSYACFRIPTVEGAGDSPVLRPDLAPEQAAGGGRRSRLIRPRSLASSCRADDQPVLWHRECATRRHVTGRDERPALGRRDDRVKLGAVRLLRWGDPGGSSPDNVPTGRRQRPGRASKAERCRETEPVVEAPRSVTGPEAGGCGPLRRSSSVCGGGRLVRPVDDRVAGAVWRVAVPRGDAAGVKLGADPAYRCMVNVGSVPVVPAEPVGFGQAHRPLSPPGRGGGTVVLRGRESRLHGEGSQRARGRL